MRIVPPDDRLLWLIAALSAQLAGIAGAQTDLQHPFYHTINGTAATIINVANVSGSISIPSTLGGQPVRTIAARAFYGVSAPAIHLPANFTTADGNAFGGGAVSITLPGCPGRGFELGGGASADYKWT